MGIASTGDVRGQQDVVGFASRADQMARAWELSADGSGLDTLGPAPGPGVAGVICPHDDYVYAGRVYRRVLPLVTARTVVLVGVFHGYRRFGAHDVLVFDRYRAWRAPDGEIPVSSLREPLLAALPAGAAVREDGWHDAEHSLEALAYWLRHARPDVEILPILVPAAGAERLEQLASRAGAALAILMRQRSLDLGRDVAVAISADAVHYGSDFKHTPFGAGGVEAYARACERDRSLLAGPLAGRASPAKAREFLSACVDADDPGTYRLTWCGRFSIPFGLMLLDATAKALGHEGVDGHPLAHATSVGQPELALREVGLGETAPANLFHFVGYPAVAYTVAK